MEFTACPKCGSFSPASAKECQDCHAPLPEQPEAPPAAPAASVPPLVAEAPAPSATPAFDAAPEVLERVRQLEAAIAQKPSATALYLQLAQVYVDAKRKDLAVQAVERCLLREPGNTYLRHRLAQLTGNPDSSPAAPVAAKAIAPAPTARTTASFQAVQRPKAPPARNLLGSLARNQKLAIGGGVLAIGLLVVLKLWLFPSTRRLVAGDFRAYAPVWSPSGGHLAFLVEDGRSTRIAVYDFAKSAHRVLGPAAAWDAGSYSWSSDGSKLAWSAPGGEGDWQQAIFVVEPEGGQPRRVGAGSAPKWAPDGSLIAVCMPEMRGAVGDDEATASYSDDDLGERYCRIDVASGEVQRTRLEPQPGAAFSAAYESVVFEQSSEQAADGAAASEQGDFEQLVDSVAAGRARNVAEGSRDLSRALEARQYDKNREAARTAQRLPYAADVFVAGLAGGEPVAVTSDRHSAFPSWTEDGSRILFATDGASGVEFCTIRPDGGDRQTVLSGVKGVDPYSVKLSRDGRQVFFVASVPGDEGMAKAMTGESPADLHVAAVGSGSAERLGNRHPFKQRYAVSPEGDRIVYEVLQDVKLLSGAGKSELWLMRR